MPVASGKCLLKKPDALAVRVPARLAAALLAVVLCLLTLRCPLYAEPARSPGAPPGQPYAGPDQGKRGQPVGQGLDTHERVLIAAIALAIAFL